MIHVLWSRAYWESILCFHHVDSMDETQFIRLKGKNLYLLNVGPGRTHART